MSVADSPIEVLRADFPRGQFRAVLFDFGPGRLDGVAADQHGLDAEAVVLLDNGTFFISDEYGPYIYRFSPEGRLLAAIRPPESFIPRRARKVL